MVSVGSSCLYLGAFEVVSDLLVGFEGLVSLVAVGSSSLYLWLLEVAGLLLWRFAGLVISPPDRAGYAMSLCPPGLKCPLNFGENLASGGYLS